MSLNCQLNRARWRSRPILGVLVVLMAAAGIVGFYAGRHRSQHVDLTSGTIPAPTRADATARPGHAFVNGAFRIIVTKVELHRQAIGSYRPARGQFVIAYLSATNVASSTARMSASASQLLDSAGHSYAAGRYRRASDELGAAQQPGTTRSGWIAFDVPAGVQAVSTLLVRPDDSSGGSTAVALG